MIKICSISRRPAAAERGGGHRHDVVARFGGQSQRRTERGTRVTGGRLHPYWRKGLSEEPGVGDAVQCDAASQSELLASRPLVEPAAQVKQDFLQHGLNTAGEVGVPLIEIGPGLAGRRERGPIHGLGAEAAVAVA